MKRLTILPISKYSLLSYLFFFSFSLFKSFHGDIHPSLMVLYFCTHIEVISNQQWLPIKNEKQANLNGETLNYLCQSLLHQLPSTRITRWSTPLSIKSSSLWSTTAIYDFLSCELTLHHSFSTPK